MVTASIKDRNTSPYVCLECSTPFVLFFKTQIPLNDVFLHVLPVLHDPCKVLDTRCGPASFLFDSVPQFIPEPPMPTYLVQCLFGTQGALHK